MENASDCWGSAEEAVEASGSMGVRGGVDERSLSFTFVSDVLSFRLNIERILDGILSGLCVVCSSLPCGSLRSTLKCSFHECSVWFVFYYIMRFCVVVAFPFNEKWSSMSLTKFTGTVRIVFYNKLTRFPYDKVHVTTPILG